MKRLKINDQKINKVVHVAKTSRSPRERDKLFAAGQETLFG